MHDCRSESSRRSSERDNEPPDHPRHGCCAARRTRVSTTTLRQKGTLDTIIVYTREESTTLRYPRAAVATVRTRAHGWFRIMSSPVRARRTCRVRASAVRLLHASVALPGTSIYGPGDRPNGIPTHMMMTRACSHAMHDVRMEQHMANERKDIDLTKHHQLSHVNSITSHVQSESLGEETKRRMRMLPDNTGRSSGDV
jgi:hypothetical protein